MHGVKSWLQIAGSDFQAWADALRDSNMRAHRKAATHYLDVLKHADASLGSEMPPELEKAQDRNIVSYGMPKRAKQIQK